MKREKAFTPIIEYHTSAYNHRFSSTQFKLRSEYAYHPRSSPMSPQHLRTKSRSATNYLCRTITTACRTNIRSSLAKIRLTVSFYIHRETPILWGSNNTTNSKMRGAARDTHLNEFICLQCITNPRAEVVAACNRGSSILL